jgi:hypothetical protein
MSDQSRAQKRARKRARRRRRRHQPQHQAKSEAQAHSIPEFCERNGVGKDTVYKEIREGRLLARKVNKRTLIFNDAEAAWRAALPVLEL